MEGIDFSMFWQGSKRGFMVGWSYVLGNIGRRMAINWFKEHLVIIAQKNTTSVFGPNTNAYFPKMYMSKDMNQKGTNPLLTKRCLCPFKKYPTRVYFPDTNYQQTTYAKIRRVYVSAENVLTITSSPSGFDPETTYSSYSDGNPKNLSATNNYIF